MKVLYWVSQGEMVLCKKIMYHQSKTYTTYILVCVLLCDTTRAVTDVHMLFVPNKTLFLCY